MAEFRRSHWRRQAAFGILAWKMHIARIYPLARHRHYQVLSCLDILVLDLGLALAEFVRILSFDVCSFFQACSSTDRDLEYI